MNESLLEYPLSAWRLFSHFFNFIKQGEPVIALISKYYIGKEATFKMDQERKMESEIVSLSLGVRHQFKIDPETPMFHEIAHENSCFGFCL